MVYPAFNPLLDMELEAKAHKSPAKKKSAKKSKPSSKSRSKKGRSSSKASKNKRKSSVSSISVIYSDSITGEWIHRGKKGIVIYKDSTDNLRAMTPFSSGASAGEEYAVILNEYADSLKKDGIRVHSLIAPTQGEFYMPELISENRSQENAIEKWTGYLDSSVQPVLICQKLRQHKDEEIYNRTDHHWSPLGAFYAAEVIASQLGLEFLPIHEYKTEVVHDYVGTMYKFSGDKEILNYPEEFIYYIPPGDYYSEFIDYTLKNNTTVGESEKHIAPLLRKFPDGSGAAYSTFLGGDSHTVKIVNNRDNSGRKLLIVKDSYGNAIVPCLINSCDEVHVIDFRYYPHSLLDYARDNEITDIVFVNCIELAFSKNTANQLKKII